MRQLFSRGLDSFLPLDHDAPNRAPKVPPAPGWGVTRVRPCDTLTSRYQETPPGGLCCSQGQTQGRGFSEGKTVTHTQQESQPECKQFKKRQKLHPFYSSPFLTVLHDLTQMHLSTRHSSNQASFISPGSPCAYGTTFPCGKQKAVASEDWKSRFSSDSRDKIAAFPTQNDYQDAARSRVTAAAGEAKGQAGVCPRGSLVPTQPSAWPADVVAAPTGSTRPRTSRPPRPHSQGLCSQPVSQGLSTSGAPASPALRGSPSHAAATLS